MFYSKTKPATSNMDRVPSQSENITCMLCKASLGPATLDKFRAHIEHCLSTRYKNDLPRTMEQTRRVPTPPTPEIDSDATVTDDSLSDSDLPPPYASTPPPNASVKTVESITASRYKTLTSATDFLIALAYPESRSTKALYAITQNAQHALQTWQDEFFALEKELVRTTDHKPRPNPRKPIHPIVFEDMKMAELYGFKYDPQESRIGRQDPFAHLRTGRMVGGKHLRGRKPASKGLHGAVESDDEGAGAGVHHRTTRRSRRLREGSEADTGASRGTSAMPEVSDTAPVRKRGRPRLNAPLSRLGAVYGAAGTAGMGLTSAEVTTEAETGLETEEGGTPAPRLNPINAGKRGRGRGRPKAALAPAPDTRVRDGASAGGIRIGSKLPGLAEETLADADGEGEGEGDGQVPPRPPPVQIQREKKRKGRPPGITGKYWGAEARKQKSARVVDSATDS